MVCAEAHFFHKWVGERRTKERELPETELLGKQLRAVSVVSPALRPVATITGSGCAGWRSVVSTGITSYPGMEN